MNDIPELNPSNNPLSKHLNAVNDSLSSQRIAKSSDFIVKSTSAGTYIGIPEHLKPVTGFINYRGVWNCSASYQVNDVVTVPSGIASGSLNFAASPALTYTHDGTLNIDKVEGNYILSGSDATSQTFDLTIGVNTPMTGTFVCVSEVPGLDYYLSLWTAFYPSTPPVLYATTNVLTDLPKLFQNNYQLARLIDVNYYPSASALPNAAVTNPNDFTQWKGRYWESLGGGGSSGGGSAGSTLLVWL